MVKVNKNGKKGEFKELTALDVVYMILPFISLGLVLFLWHYVSKTTPDMFPSMQATWEQLIKLFEKPIMRVPFHGHIFASLKRVVMALLAAVVIGVPFGAMLGWNQKLDSFFGSIFNVIRPIPPLAWIPLIIISFGIGEFPKVLIVFIGAVMPIVINTRAGLRSVEQIYLDVGTLFDANRFQLIMEVAIPCATPAIIAGIKTATSTGWMVVLAAEMLASKSGVGFLVTRGMDANNMPLVLVAMITIGIVGALLGVITSFIERLLCPWLQIK